MPAFKATHKTGAIVITSSASSVELVAILSLLVFVIGKEFIGQTQVDFYRIPWMAASESGGIETLHFMTET